MVEVATAESMALTLKLDNSHEMVYYVYLEPRFSEVLHARDGHSFRIVGVVNSRIEEKPKKKNVQKTRVENIIYVEHSLSESMESRSLKNRLPKNSTFISFHPTGTTVSTLEQPTISGCT